MTEHTPWNTPFQKHFQRSKSELPVTLNDSVNELWSSWSSTRWFIGEFEPSDCWVEWLWLIELLELFLVDYHKPNPNGLLIAMLASGKAHIRLYSRSSQQVSLGTNTRSKTINCCIINNSHPQLFREELNLRWLASGRNRLDLI